MMVWYNLTIGKYHLKYTPLKSETKSYEDVDKDGNPLKRVVEGHRITYFIDDKGNKHDRAFKLINGKPYAKLDKTKVVNTFKEVDKKEVDDLLTEKEYLVECDYLLDDLSNSGKALKFGFSNGNGFKTYLAYVYVSELYPNLLFMSLGNSQKSTTLSKLKELQNIKKKAESINLTIQGIDKAKIEDLIQI